MNKKIAHFSMDKYLPLFMLKLSVKKNSNVYKFPIRVLLYILLKRDLFIKFSLNILIRDIAILWYLKV